MAAQTPAASLQPGDALPPISGISLAGNSIDLPAAVHGSPSVLLFTFSREAGHESRAWDEHLASEQPHTPVYTVIFLESAPRMLRSIIVSGIRKNMPPAVQQCTLVLDHDESAWKQHLAVADASHVRIIVVSAGGALSWVGAGPYSVAAEREVRKHVSP